MEYDSDWCQKMLKILEERTSINSETGCWEWQGSIKTDDGYGRVYIDKKPVYIHRLAAMIFHGYRPEYTSLSVLHKCNIRHCWNRDHLYVGTQTDNMQDKARNITHCPQGHEYNEENTRYSKRADGGMQRQCKECVRIRTREWREKKKFKEGA